MFHGLFSTYFKVVSAVDVFGVLWLFRFVRVLFFFGVHQFFRGAGRSGCFFLDYFVSLG